MSSFVHPLITYNGYELVAVSQFLASAPSEHIERYRRDCIGKGQFIIWDPNDDADGFMLCLPTIAELNAEFIAHFDGFLSAPQEESR